MHICPKCTYKTVAWTTDGTTDFFKCFNCGFIVLENVISDQYLERQMNNNYVPPFVDKVINEDRVTGTVFE